MKRFTILLLLLCVVLTTSGQEGNPLTPAKRFHFNFGVKAGFNSSLYVVSKFKIQDVTIDETQNNYKIGGFASLFARFNIGDHYLQPEVSYQLSRCQVSFDKLGSQHPELEPEYALITSQLHSLDFPLLYGYNIIKKGPYGLSVFAGPKFKYLWKQKNSIDFENFDQKLEEELHPINLSLTGGVAVNISRIFFDFRYDHGLTNISKSINYVTEEGKTDSNITFRRKEHVLSFSIGMMF